MRVRHFNRAHTLDDAKNLRELAGVTGPAVVVRLDGSLDVYGPITVLDQRPDPIRIGGELYDPRGTDKQHDPATCPACSAEAAFQARR